MKQCLKISVSGKVQGVEYRDFVREQAGKHSVEGTIQNFENSSVIIYACGLSENLDKLIDNLYKGSTHSKVSDIKIEPFIKEKDFRNVFRIIVTD